MTLIGLVEGFIGKELLWRGSIKNVVSLPSSFFRSVSLTSSTWRWWENRNRNFGNSTHQWWVRIIISGQVIVNVLRVITSRPYSILLFNRPSARSWYEREDILLLRLKLEVDFFDSFFFSLLTNIAFQCFCDSCLCLSLQVTKICNGIHCSTTQMITQKLPWMLLYVIIFHLIVIRRIWPALWRESISHTVQNCLIVVRVSRRFMHWIINIPNFGVSIATDSRSYWSVKAQCPHSIVTAILLSHDSEFKELWPLPCLAWEYLFLPLIFKKHHIVFIISGRFPKTLFLL